MLGASMIIHRPYSCHGSSHNISSSFLPLDRHIPLLQMSGVSELLCKPSSMERTQPLLHQYLVEQEVYEKYNGTLCKSEGRNNSNTSVLYSQLVRKRYSRVVVPKSVNCEGGLLQLS